MYIYILLVGYVVAAGIFTDVTDKVQKRNYCISVCFILILILGFRSEELGLYDTSLAYVPHFNSMQSFSFKEILMSTAFEDKGFYIFAKIFSLICNNSQAWLFIIGIPLPVAISVLIYKESNCPYISYLFYFALGYFGYSFFLLRQVMALSFCLFAYLYFENCKKRKKIISFFLLAIAFSFHATSVIFVLVFLLNRQFIKKYSNIISMLIVAVGLVFGRLILSYVFAMTSWNRILGYKDSELAINNSLLFIYLVIYIVLLIIKLMTKINEEKYNYQLVVFSVAVFFMSLVQYVGNIYRMAIYFGVFSIVLCPNILCGRNFTNESKILIKMALVSLLGYIFWAKQIWGSNLAPYIFFWN